MIKTPAWKVGAAGSVTLLGKENAAELIQRQG
jgi:hypothetical protein